jgi:hypothetical protein
VSPIEKASMLTAYWLSHKMDPDGIHHNIVLGKKRTICGKIINKIIQASIASQRGRIPRKIVYMGTSLATLRAVTGMWWTLRLLDTWTFRLYF